MKILISGTPGTGKTTVAKLLGKKMNLAVLNVTDIVKTEKLGKLVNEEYEVDLKKLYNALKGEKGIIESHLVCEIPLGNEIFILRCNPSELKRRLNDREYSEDKIKDNLEAEALDYCSQVAAKHYKKVIDVDTTGLTVNQTVNKLVNKIKTKQSDKVDFSGFLLNSF